MPVIPLSANYIGCIPSKLFVTVQYLRVLWRLGPIRSVSYLLLTLFKNKFMDRRVNYLMFQDATLSPGVFLACPLEAGASRLWFINLWNLQLGTGGGCPGLLANLT